jgi:hypothetical protein
MLFQLHFLFNDNYITSMKVQLHTAQYFLCCIFCALPIFYSASLQRLSAQPLQAPAAPVAKSLQDFNRTGMALQWDSVAQATGYRFDIALDSTFESIIPGLANKETTTQLSLTPVPWRNQAHLQMQFGFLPSWGKYYARVRAYNAAGVSPASNTVVYTAEEHNGDLVFFDLAVQRSLAGSYRLLARWDNDRQPKTYQIRVPALTGSQEILQTVIPPPQQVRKFQEIALNIPPVVAQAEGLPCMLIVGTPRQRQYLRVKQLRGLPEALWRFVQRVEEVGYYQAPEYGDSTYYLYDILYEPSGFLRKTRSDSILTALAVLGIPVDTAWYRSSLVTGQTPKALNAMLVVKLRRADARIHTIGRWQQARPKTMLFAPILWEGMEFNPPLRYIFQQTGVSVREELSRSALEGVNTTPNPASDLVQLAWQQQRAGAVELTLVDMLGRVAQAHSLGMLSAGEQRTSLSVAALPAGVYALRLEAGGHVSVQRVVVRR